MCRARWGEQSINQANNVTRHSFHVIPGCLMMGMKAPCVQHTAVQLTLFIPTRDGLSCLPVTSKLPSWLATSGGDQIKAHLASWVCCRLAPHHPLQSPSSSLVLQRSQRTLVYLNWSILFLSIRGLSLGAHVEHCAKRPSCPPCQRS